MKRTTGAVGTDLALRRGEKRLARTTTTCLAAALVGLSMGTLSVPGAAYASDASRPSVMSQGRVWEDGLDTRLQSQSFVDAAGRAGFTGSSLGGRLQPADWFDRAADAQVVGFFGHGNSGLFAPADDGSAYLYAGSVDAYNHRVGGDLTGATVNLSSYLPQEIDDVRLLIFSSCYSSQRFSDSYYSLPEAARLRGVDSALAFKGLIYSPTSTGSRPVAETKYSGGYLWSRVSHHLGDGKSIGVALTRGLNELYAKEGSYAGYHRYVIEGASTAPASVTLRSTAETSPAAGVDAASVSRWLLARSGGSAANDLHEREVAADTYARFDAAGRLFDIVGNARTEGADVVDRHAAAELAAVVLSGLSALDIDQLESMLEPVTDVQGERVFRLEWSGITAQGAQRFVSLDIDRRSGRIVRLLNTQGAAPASSAPDVSRETAIETALAAGPGQQTLGAFLNEWTGRDRWIVTTVTDQGARVRHEIDAVSGRHLRASMATSNLRS